MALRFQRVGSNEGGSAMRKLIFALTAAFVISFAAPASAQIFDTACSRGDFVGVGWVSAYPLYNRWCGAYGHAYSTYPVVRRPIVLYSAYAYAPGYRPYARVRRGCYGWYCSFVASIRSAPV